MEAVLDFNKYYLPEQVKGFELFIGPDGEYYKVKILRIILIIHIMDGQNNI